MIIARTAPSLPAGELRVWPLSVREPGTTAAINQKLPHQLAFCWS
jgi:hypothetical protein